MEKNKKLLEQSDKLQIVSYTHTPAVINARHFSNLENLLPLN
jgi:hypothetical protein